MTFVCSPSGIAMGRTASAALGKHEAMHFPAFSMLLLWVCFPLRSSLVFCSAEFTREVTDTQMPHVAPVILPEMYKIFTMAEVYLHS